MVVIWTISVQNFFVTVETGIEDFDLLTPIYHSWPRPTKEPYKIMKKWVLAAVAPGGSVSWLSTGDCTSSGDVGSIIQVTLVRFLIFHEIFFLVSRIF